MILKDLVKVCYALEMGEIYYDGDLVHDGYISEFDNDLYLDKKVYNLMSMKQYIYELDKEESILIIELED